MWGMSFRYWFMLAVLGLVTACVFGLFLTMLYGIIRL